MQEIEKTFIRVEHPYNIASEKCGLRDFVPIFRQYVGFRAGNKTLVSKTWENGS